MRGRDVVVLLSIVILFSVFVAAKGSSSWDTGKPAVANCEEKATIKERVECRLVNGGAAAIPEACNGLKVQEECVAFYNKAGYCYDEVAEVKDACFRKESGYASDASRQRYYINALLYELQEYVEDDYDSGKLSSGKAAELITHIIEMKRKNLGGFPLETVLEMLQEYKVKRGGQN